jgi:hypothetical protein
VPWSHPIFMVINYSLLIIVYIFISMYQRKRRAITLQKSFEQQYADQE